MTDRRIRVEAYTRAIHGRWRVFVHVGDEVHVLSARGALALSDDWTQRYGEQDPAVEALVRLAGVAMAGGCPS